MYVHSLLLFLCCVLLTEGLNEGRPQRTRRDSCEFGTYQHGERTCCLCPKGSWVFSNCNDTHKTQCKPCVDGTFITHANSDDSCQLCKVCDSKANMEMLVRCSLDSDTVCRCKAKHYCDKGDLCRACYPCDACKEHGVNQLCTETTDAVCKNPQPLNIGKGCFITDFRTIVAVLVALLLAAGVVIFCLWKQGKLYLNLHPHLPNIADVLGWKTMRSIARRSDMSETDIEALELDHRSDAKEQTFKLLDAWYQSQGLHGAYPKLINTLHHMNERRKADKIQNIVEEEAEP
ncbi:hypothetical protein Q8A67_019617 [Cirrhinus molitorella]|uniref:Tumor necrosis factor receptor superfamily member 6 n=1 Tax=Cirrhinus molitorella TaxID=172907 RepID=A0AA88PCR6_9TELE|nr:hypothetical protein Q8A67_019617 [Cirrhinus molitorella]